MKQKGAFLFKQFSVSHQQSAMRVGTDGVLLGAWTPMGKETSILDVGTGCGLIALMLAQRNAQANITGIDIHEPSIREAQLNAQSSPWPDRLSFLLTDLQAFGPQEKFDLIVSNPPFFTAGNGSPEESRFYARHTDQLTFDTLTTSSADLLTTTGHLSVIIPTLEEKAFLKAAQRAGLHLRHLTHFLPRCHTSPERSLMYFANYHVSSHTEDQLVHYQEGIDWSEDYKKLTREFYLKL